MHFTIPTNLPDDDHNGRLVSTNSTWSTNVTMFYSYVVKRLIKQFAPRAFYSTNHYMGIDYGVSGRMVFTEISSVVSTADAVTVDYVTGVSPSDFKSNPTIVT